MVETGDWVTPRLYGKPWFEKPPLFYWGAALCFKLFGVSEAAARLPSAISALLATFALAWLALRLYGADTARWILLLLPTTVGMIGFSHAAATDMPFTGMLTIAMVAAAVVLGLVPRTAVPSLFLASFAPSTFFASVLFGFFLGLAVLAKGPAAIILCGGSVFFWALITKRWRDAFGLFHPAGIVIFCVTALPWYILCARRNPDFFRVFIIEHNFNRYLTPEFQHMQPFWFYAPILLLAFLPWTAVFLSTIVMGFLGRILSQKIGHASGLFLSWATFSVAFFSASQSKLPGYVLPALPAIGMLVARSCPRRAKGRQFFFAAALLTTSAVAICGMVYLSTLDPRSLAYFPTQTGLLYGLLLAVTLSNALLAGAFFAERRTNLFWALAATAIVPILLEFFFAGAIIQRSETATFPITARAAAKSIGAAGIPLSKLFVLELPRGMSYGLNFYLLAVVPVWNQESSKEAYILARYKSCADMSWNGNCTDLWNQQYRPDGLHLLHLVPNVLAARAPNSGKPQ